MKKPYTIDTGIDTSHPDGDYEYIAVYDPQGYACAIFYADAIPNAEAEAQDLCNRLNQTICKS